MTSRGEGRIWFEGNPWPQGHRLVSCELVGVAHPLRGADVELPAGVVAGPALSLAIELASAPYDEGDDPAERDAIGDDDWTFKIVWNNYGAATIAESASSQTPGFAVSDGRTPFIWDAPSHRFLVDRLPLTLPGFSDFFTVQALGCYVLGHDAVADHDIHLHSRSPDGGYVLDWTGRLARAYAGIETFDHRFRVHATGVKLREISLWYFDVERAKEYLGLDLDPTMTPEACLAPFVPDVSAFTFETRVDSLGRSAVYAVPRHG